MTNHADTKKQASAVFHGTLADATPGIIKEGIRFTEGEPVFTTDLFLAGCKYADRGSNPPRYYSGQTVAEARKLLKDGLIPDYGVEEKLLETARQYWEDHDDSGTVFIISTSRWIIGPGPTAILQIDPVKKEVRGGLTKWLYNHRALYVNLEDLTESSMERFRETIARELTTIPKPALRRSLNIPPSDILVQLPIRPEFKKVLRRYSRQATGRENPAEIDDTGDVIKQTLRKMMPAHSEISLPFNVDSLIGFILKEMKKQAIVYTLKQCFLSTLRTKGYKMMKTDHVVPYEEDAHVFLKEGEIDSHLTALSGVLNNEWQFSRHCHHVYFAIRQLRQTGHGGDNPFMIYRALNHCSDTIDQEDS